MQRRKLPRAASIFFFPAFSGERVFILHNPVYNDGNTVYWAIAPTARFSVSEIEYGGAGI